MNKIEFRELWCESARFWTGLAVVGFTLMLSVFAFLYMEHNGHHVSNMNNSIVWGMPHVFAIFLIVAASGALNVASIGSVFGVKAYKPLGRFSALLALALLAGGLVVLLADLGRPDRLIVAITVYNFKSIFAWNIILYSGFFAIVIAYLWSMMERKASAYTRAFGFAAFSWRLVLTMGTGSIFGFIVAREAYDAAIMAPYFIIMSFSFGLAAFNLFLVGSYIWGDRELGDVIVTRLKNLLGVFIGAVLFMTLIYHLSNLYVAQHHGNEGFILMDGGLFTQVFWIGQILLGSVLPLFLIFSPAFAKSLMSFSIASAFVILGGFSAIFTILVGGQAYPMNIFPGKEVIESTFADGIVVTYTPTLAEFTLGFGGITIAVLIVMIATRMFKILPLSLADATEK